MGAFRCLAVLCAVTAVWFLVLPGGGADATDTVARPGLAAGTGGTGVAASSKPDGGDLASPRLPLAFVENQGQWDDSIRYRMQWGNVAVAVKSDAVILRPRFALNESPCVSKAGVSIRFADSSPKVRVRASGLLAGYYNYFLGTDRSRWRARVPAFSVVTYEGLYEGIDLVLREQQGQLEYDLRLQPGADLDAVVFQCEGVDGLEIDADGSLVMATPFGRLTQAAPPTWEETVEGEHVALPCRYRILGPDRYGFEVGSRNESRLLVIDPGLIWSTFLGGAKGDGLLAVTMAANGDLLIAGATGSADFPVTVGAYDENGGLPQDLFVTRLTSDGSALVYSTFIGGAEVDVLEAVSISPGEEVTLAGLTISSDYPTTSGAFSGILKGARDPYVTRLSASGDSLVYSTLIGGTEPAGFETAHAVVSRNDGAIVLSGSTCALDFPLTPDAADSTYYGVGCDGFLAVLDPSKSGSEQLIYGSYFFGGGLSQLVIQPDGTLIGTGTGRSDFPVTPGAFDVTYSPALGGADGIVCLLGADVKSLLVATFLDFKIGDMATGPQGITMVGDMSQQLLTPGSYDVTPNGALDISIGRISGDLTAWVWGTLLGGSKQDAVSRLTVNADGDVFLTGQASSPNFPTTPGAFDTIHSGGLADAFVASLSSDGSTLLYSTFLGSSTASVATGSAVAVSGEDEIVIVGGGANAAFPVTAGAFDTTFNGIGPFDSDGFVVKLKLQAPWSSSGAGIAGVSGVPKLSGAGTLCADEPVSLQLVRAKPDGLATLVIGLGALQLPFKGGTLVPAPDVLIPGLPVSAGGSLVLSGTWPGGLPAGFSVYFQAWIADGAAVQGLAASNGLVATVP
jgi:hypothetical protein